MEFIPKIFPHMRRVCLTITSVQSTTTCTLSQLPLSLRCFTSVIKPIHILLTTLFVASVDLCKAKICSIIFNPWYRSYYYTLPDATVTNILCIHTTTEEYYYPPVLTLAVKLMRGRCSHAPTGHSAVRCDADVKPTVLFYDEMKSPAQYILMAAGPLWTL